jgi:hypothetical protein
MTPAEFKAWFDGFTEAFSGCPSKAQWARIKARVAEIDGQPITERVYIDRYIQQYWRPSYPAYIPTWSTTCGPTYEATGGFNSLTAMNVLGRSEASTITGAQ